MATIVGVFGDELQAEAVAEELRLNFDDSTIAVVTDWQELQVGSDSPLKGISARLSALGVNNNVISEYAERTLNGEVLVVARISDAWLPTAQRILRRANPIDIDILPEMPT